MKKRFGLFICAFVFLFLLSACNKITSISNEEKLISNAGLNNIIVSQGITQNPEIEIENATGEIIDDGNRDGLYYKVVSGYKYIYYYKDLGLEISTLSRTLVDEGIFLSKFTGEVFSRSGNMVYFGSGPDMEYIIVHEKDPNVSLEDEVFNKYIIEGCEVYTGFLSDDTRGLSGFYYVNLYNRGLELDSCVITKGNLELHFIVDSKKSGKYLEISDGSDCAPGPCSVFGEIKLY